MFYLLTINIGKHLSVISYQFQWVYFIFGDKSLYLLIYSSTGKYNDYFWPRVNNVHETFKTYQE